MDIKTIQYSLKNDFSSTTPRNVASSIQFNNGANWSNQTANITPITTTGVNLINLSGVNYGATGSAWYFGSDTKFDTLCMQFTASTSTQATRTILYEYWNGSTWTTLDQTTSTRRISIELGSIIFSNTSIYCFKIHPQIYGDWATTTVNSVSAYYIRMTIGVAALTTASLATVSIWDHKTNVGTGHIGTVYQTVDDSSFTDNTLAAASFEAGAFTFTANTTNARLYLGFVTNEVFGIRTQLSTAGTVGTVVLEYWNGSTWSTLPFESFGALVATDGAAFYNLKATNICNYAFTPPTDWTTSSINSKSAYWVRFRVTDAYTVQPIFQLIDVIKPETISNTIYIPETSNRNFISVFAKINLYNPLIMSMSGFYAQGKIGSGIYKPLQIGETNTPTATFLQLGGKVFSTTANDGVFTDGTSAVSNSSTTGGGLMALTNTINSNVYFCYPNDSKWVKEEISLSIRQSAVANGGILVWEYWNGSAWTLFTPTLVYGSGSNLNTSSTQPCYVQMPILTNWSSTTVNGFTGYIFRRRITTQYSSVGSWSQVATSLVGVNQTILTNTGENNSYNLLIDLKDLFTEHFTGASHSVTVSIAQAGNSLFKNDTTYISGELLISYYADNQNTRIKTVNIPIDSSDVALLTTGLTSIGSNQIPQLSTYLPEESKTIRNFYIKATGNDSCDTAINQSLIMRLDSDTPMYTWPKFSGGQTGNIFSYIFEKNDINISTAHNIQMGVSARNTNRIKNFSLVATVTYEYDSSTTTRCINSMILPWETSSIFLPQDESSKSERIDKHFYIEEPGTIDNVKIGAYISFTDISNPILNYKGASESSFTRLLFNGGSVTCGGYRVSKIMGKNTLSRGLNSVEMYLYSEMVSNVVPSCAYTCGYYLINYHSDVYSGGIENHNKTVSCLLLLQRNNIQRNVAENKLSNPLTNWYLNDFGFSGELYQTVAINPGPTIDTRIILENASTHLPQAVMGAGGGWQENESLLYDIFMSNRGIFKKYPQDVEILRPINVFTGSSDNWLLEYGYTTMFGGIYSLATCHEITYPVSGTVIGATGLSGDGSGLTVTFYDNDTSDPLFTLTTAVGGTFSGVWYDNVSEIVADVYDPISDIYTEGSPGIAGTDTFDLSFSSGGSTKSYAFIG